MRKRFSSSRGFVLLEALFSLMLVAISLSFFAFYLSLPKLPSGDQVFSPPSLIHSSEDMSLKSSSGLIFRIKRLQIRENQDLYIAFEVQ